MIERHPLINRTVRLTVMLDGPAQSAAWMVVKVGPGWLCLKPAQDLTAAARWVPTDRIVWLDEVRA